MSIGHIREKIKEIGTFCDKRAVYTAFIIVFTAISSFVLGGLARAQDNALPVLLETNSIPCTSHIQSLQLTQTSSKSVTKTKAKKQKK